MMLLSLPSDLRQCSLLTCKLRQPMSVPGVVQKVFFRGNPVKGHPFIPSEAKPLEDRHPSFEPGPDFPFFSYAVKDEIQKSQS